MQLLIPLYQYATKHSSITPLVSELVILPLQALMILLVAIAIFPLEFHVLLGELRVSVLIIMLLHLLFLRINP